MTETESTTMTEPAGQTRQSERPERAEQEGRTERTERAKRGENDRKTPSRESDPRRYLYQGALVVLVLLAIVALFQFYMSALDVIRTFVADQYRPLFNAAFNLVVLLAAGVGISFVVRSMD